MTNRARAAVALVVSVVAVVAAWHVAVGWDLSEVEPDGFTAVEGGGDDAAGRMLWPWGASLAATAVITWRRWANDRLAVTVPMAAVLILLLWLSATARTTGANMWMVGLFLYPLPMLVAGGLAARAGAWLRRRGEAPSA